MEYRLIQSAKGIWVFIDNRHKKTLPKNYLQLFETVKDELSYDKKRLTNSERKIFDNALFSQHIESFKQDLKMTDLHLFRLVEKAKPLGVRFVNSKNGNRFEVKFDNNLFLKIPKTLYHFSTTELETAYLNY